MLCGDIRISRELIQQQLFVVIIHVTFKYFVWHDFALVLRQKWVFQLRLVNSFSFVLASNWDLQFMFYVFNYAITYVGSMVVDRKTPAMLNTHHTSSYVGGFKTVFF